MALNYPGPCQLRVYYTVNPEGLGNLTHRMALNFIPLEQPQPGDNFDEIDVVRRGGSNRKLDLLLTDWINLLKPLYNNGETTFDYAECWWYPPASFDPTYISTESIGVSATGSGTSFAASQMIYSFRSTEGNPMKVYLQEASNQFDRSLGYSEMNAANQAMVDFVIAADNAPFVARDTSYPLAFLRLFPGQSEALFRRRYR